MHWKKEKESNREKQRGFCHHYNYDASQMYRRIQMKWLPFFNWTIFVFVRMHKLINWPLNVRSMHHTHKLMSRESAFWMQ